MRLSSWMCGGCGLVLMFQPWTPSRQPCVFTEFSTNITIFGQGETHYTEVKLVNKLHDRARA
jgi:hypothetical protein